MNRMRLLLLVITSLYYTFAQAQTGDLVFDHTTLHEIRLYFSDENFWDEMTENYQDNIGNGGYSIPYTPAIMEFDGYVLDTVGVRQKGKSSYNYSNDNKKGLKIDINEFISGQKLDGLKKIGLHNGACDPAMMRDFLVYNIHRTAGVKAPRVSYCKLYLNDEYWGLYGIIEQIDGTFADNNFASEDGNLFKNGGWSELHWEGNDPAIYKEEFELKTNEEEDDWTQFVHFLDVLNNSSDEEFATEIERVFDVDLFLHVMAIDAMTNNWDSYLDNRRNWYLYHEPKSNKFQWIPWDYNLSLGGTFNYEGNPFPPTDPNCDLLADFRVVKNGSSVTFIENSTPPAEYYYWEFPDGTISNSQNPTHEFATEGTVNVCFTGAKYNDEGALCQHRRCKKIDLSFSPTSCNTVENGTSPYPGDDPVYQMVVEEDDYCCYDTWDAICELSYYNISQGLDVEPEMGVDYYVDLPLILNNPDKVLVDRLLDVPEFRQRYLDISCIIRENNFNEERLFPLIDQQADLIREAIYDDPNYIFTWDYFEYDVGNGSGGGGGAHIPALKWVLEQRFLKISADLAIAGANCSNAFSQIEWHDIVINEFMASNQEGSGIVDSSGEAEDWIELYNNTDQTIDLSNFYLTDDPDDPFKWHFPVGLEIEAHGYLTIWADNDEVQEGLHSNFKLSKSGEMLRLLHEDGTVIDEFEFGEQITNVSSARIPNGTGDFEFKSPTFNDHNENPNSTVEFFEKAPFKAYPNPTQNFLTIEVLQSISNQTTVNIKNVLGQTVLPQRITGNESIITLNVSNLSSGVYLIELEDRGKKWTEKIIIE